MNESAIELDACMMLVITIYYTILIASTLQRGFLEPTICITIESIMSYHLLEKILFDKSPHLLPAMNLIENARTLREKEANNDCIANLNRAIEMLREFDAIENDHGPSYFMQAQALCLRSLCRYEEHDSSLECKQAFIRDIDRALMLWSNNEFVDKNKRILQYTTNHLHFVFDVLITAHNENSHELLERIPCLFETRRSVGMLWQFKSHHNHLGSERFHNQLESGKILLSWGNDEFLIKEGDSTEDLERIASDIRKKV
ncbi:hypothetical protein Tco_0439779 [Tanacetum coccineum]